MLHVDLEVRASAIHGRGLFARQPIEAGAIVWSFGSGDTRMPIAEADAAALHFGYVNPENPAWLVVCGDDSRWWNFAETPNCGMLGAPTAHDEAPLVALRAIAAGEELTIGTETDADAPRKLGRVVQQA